MYQNFERPVSGYFHLKKKINSFFWEFAFQFFFCYYTILYDIIQYYMILYNTIWHYTILYDIIPYFIQMNQMKVRRVFVDCAWTFSLSKSNKQTKNRDTRCVAPCVLHRNTIVQSRLHVFTLLNSLYSKKQLLRSTSFSRSPSS